MNANEKLSRWLDLKCDTCGETRTEHARDIAFFTDWHPYQPPDPEDGRTMLAVLLALRERPLHQQVQFLDALREAAWNTGSGASATRRPLWPMLCEGLPGAVWAAAEAVKAAEA